MPLNEIVPQQRETEWERERERERERDWHASTYHIPMIHTLNSSADFYSVPTIQLALPYMANSSGHISTTVFIVWTHIEKIMLTLKGEVNWSSAPLPPSLPLSLSLSLSLSRTLAFKRRDIHTYIHVHEHAHIHIHVYQYYPTYIHTYVHTWHNNIIIPIHIISLYMYRGQLLHE